jgi:hypothetical protein
MTSKFLTNADISPQVIDTVAPLAWFAKTGYYVVAGKIFRHKVYAMQEATRLQLQPQDITWVFNNDVYNNMDWKTPTNTSLVELYRLRAQQLREKYDYLILSFSGGGDSTNVLDSFVLNNIRLDEVLVYWPHKHTRGKYTASLDPDSTNFLSEWDYLIEPKLQWLQSVSPDTKITILDWTDGLQAKEPQQDLVELTVHHNYLGYKRYQAVDALLIERQTVYKNYALITGINTPALVRVKQHLMTYFVDAPVCGYGSDYTAQGLCRNIEFFYWTPDMPEIVKAQSHALLDVLKAHPSFLNQIPEWSVNGSTEVSVHGQFDQEQSRKWTKSILYPTYNYQNLQVNKNTSPLHSSEWFSWFYNNPHSEELTQPHRDGIASHQKLIAPDFFITRNNQVHAYRNYRSKFYHVGNLQ